MSFKKKNFLKKMTILEVSVTLYIYIYIYSHVSHGLTASTNKTVMHTLPQRKCTYDLSMIH